MVVKRALQDAGRRIISQVIRVSLSRPIHVIGALRSYGLTLSYIWIYFILVAGTLNAATNASTPGISSQIIVTNASIQSVTETVILVFIFTLGVLGFFCFYKSGRQAIRAKYPVILFLAGMALVSVSLWLGYYYLQLKCPPYGKCG
jgi:hypothetical protein